MSLPNIVIVYESHEKNDDATYLIANKNLEEAVGDLEPHEKRLVGTYKLVGKRDVTVLPKILKERRVAR